MSKYGKYLKLGFILVLFLIVMGDSEIRSDLPHFYEVSDNLHACGGGGDEGQEVGPCICGDECKCLCECTDLEPDEWNGNRCYCMDNVTCSACPPIFIENPYEFYGYSDGGDYNYGLMVRGEEHTYAMKMQRYMEEKETESKICSLVFRITDENYTVSSEVAELVDDGVYTSQITFSREDVLWMMGIDSSGSIEDSTIPSGDVPIMIKAVYDDTIASDQYPRFAKLVAYPNDDPNCLFEFDFYVLYRQQIYVDVYDKENIHVCSGESTDVTGVFAFTWGEDDMPEHLDYTLGSVNLELRESVSGGGGGGAASCATLVKDGTEGAVIAYSGDDVKTILGQSTPPGYEGIFDFAIKGTGGWCNVDLYANLSGPGPDQWEERPIIENLTVQGCTTLDIGGFYECQARPPMKMALSIHGMGCYAPLARRMILNALPDNHSIWK